MNIPLIRKNGVTLVALPWDQPKTEPEKPVTVREAYAPTVKTPKVAKPRISSPCRFAEWDEDLLAEEWRSLCRDEGHIQGLPINATSFAERARESAKKRTEKPVMMMAIIRHLMMGDDTRDGIRIALRSSPHGVYHKHLARAEECGWVRKYRSMDGWRYALLGKGYRAFAEMGGE